MATKAAVYTNGSTPTPPHDPKAERALLGSLIVDNDAIVEVDYFLRSEHFYSKANGLVYQAIVDLSRKNQPVDIVSLMAHLRKMGHADIGDKQDTAEGFLIGLVESGAVVESAYLAKVVESLAIRRQIIHSASKMATMAYDQTGELDDQIAESEKMVMGFRGERTTENTEQPAAYVDAWLSHLYRMRDSDSPMIGLPSGFVDLDRMLKGFIAENVYYLGARPGMGKSTLLLNIAMHQALKLGKRVFFWTGEMSSRQLMDRMTANMSGIDAEKIRSGNLTDNEMESVQSCAGRISSSGLIIDTTAGITPSKLRAKAVREWMQSGLDALFVDYIGLMRPDRLLSNKNNELSEISQSLKEIASTLKIPVIAASQLSRGVESRSDKRPSLSDLRDSGSLEQDGYAVMFLYRDGYYNGDMAENDYTELIVAKHRDGASGTVPLYDDLARFRFANYQSEAINL